MAKGKLTKAVLDRIARSAKNGYPKAKKGSKPVNKGAMSYKKKAPNFDKFKQTRGFPTEGKYAMTKAAKKPGFKTGVAAGAAAGVAASKGAGVKKAKSKESPTKRMAGEAYKKQKEKQKKYYDKRRESKGK